MKTIKNILYALFAAAVLVMVGCTKDQTYTKGGDLSGEQVYIDNSTSTFYVQTAAEKEEEAKELEKLSKGLVKNEVYTDDTYVDLKIVRKGTKLDVYEFEVLLTLAADDVALFTLPDGSTQKGLNQAEETVVYSVPCSFEEGVSETLLRIGFDLATLATNTDYEFAVELADLANSSNYGADNFEFAINHSVPVELPFEDCGSITFHSDGWYADWNYSDIVIQVHKDDKKALEAGAPLTHVRFLIPRVMYQLCAASVAAGDGIASEADMEYFSVGDGLLLAMTPNYEIFEDFANMTYPHPVFPDQYKAQYPMAPIAGLSPNGETLYATLNGTPTPLINLPAYKSNYSSDVYGFWAPGISADYSRSMNTYTYPIYYYMFGIGGWPDNALSFTWDKNTLEDDWANYFKIDYNNDVNYTALGSGVFTSEYNATSVAKTLYTGHESVYGETVYYVADAYTTATAETGNLGLALTWNGTTAKVTEKQPLNIQWNGRELYASQSEKVKSAVEFDENGAVKKITFGVAIVNEEGAVLGDYTETFEYTSQGNISYFLGDFYMQQQIFVNYSPVFNESMQQQYPQLREYYGNVTISRVAADSNEVTIEGLIPEQILRESEEEGGYFNYAGLNLPAGGKVTGTYDPVSNSIIIPAQYFYRPEYVVSGVTYFPFFQPCVADYGYNYTDGSDPTTYYWYSEAVSFADEIALYLDMNTGMLYFDSSTTCGDVATTFIVDLYAYDADYDEFYYTNQSLFMPFVSPYLVANAGAAPLSMSAPKSSFQKMDVLSKKTVTMGAKSERKEIARTPKAYPFR